MSKKDGKALACDTTVVCTSDSTYMTQIVDNIEHNIPSNYTVNCGDNSEKSLNINDSNKNNSKSGERKDKEKIEKRIEVSTNTESEGKAQFSVLAWVKCKFVPSFWISGDSTAEAKPKWAQPRASNSE